MSYCVVSYHIVLFHGISYIVSCGIAYIVSCIIFIEELVRITREYLFAFIIGRLVSPPAEIYNFLRLLFRFQTSSISRSSLGVWFLPSFEDKESEKSCRKNITIPVRTSNRSFLFDVATGSQREAWEAVWSGGTSWHKKKCMLEFVNDEYV